MKLTEDDIVKELFEITHDSNGLSDLEAKLYQSNLLQQILSNEVKAEKYDEFLRVSDDSISELEQENKELKEIIEKTKEYVKELLADKEGN